MITRHPARTSWSRRDMLRGSAVALMGAYGLAPRYGLAADIPIEYDGSKFQMAAPEPNPKRGGVMRYGILNRPPHFHLRQGVQFHDGTDFTSADIKATFERIAKPPTGASIPRTPLFRAVSEINARDKYTVEFKLAAPRSINFMMSAFASGWNVIFSKKTLEENN
jgi:peptide/nickel transport system substrate-binding protein